MYSFTCVSYMSFLCILAAALGNLVSDVCGMWYVYFMCLCFLSSSNNNKQYTLPNANGVLQSRNLQKSLQRYCIARPIIILHIDNF